MTCHTSSYLINTTDSNCSFTLYASRYMLSSMIKSFRCRDTQKLFEGRCPSRLRALQRIAERKLQQLDAATTLDFLRSPPGNRLEKLRGDREDQYSIRINQQFRICFRWEDGHVHDVEITDYH